MLEDGLPISPDELTGVRLADMKIAGRDRAGGNAPGNLAVATAIDPHILSLSARILPFVLTTGMNRPVPIKK
jgi:hypothetical protein